MRTTVIIEHLTCDDCRPIVIDAFETFNGISNVICNMSNKSLSFDYKTHNVLEGLRLYLAKIGHPITEDPNLIKEPPVCIMDKLGR